MTREIKMTVGETDRTLPARMRAQLVDLPRGAQRDEVVATLNGYVAAKKEWGKLGYDVFYEAMNLIRETASPELPHLNLYRGPPNEDDDDALVRAEKPADERSHYPEFKESYWALRARPRGWLRLAATEMERRALALAWSGYVVGLQEHRLLPPGHAARLMAELVHWLRPGDPWEALARGAGLDMAALDPASAGPGPWRDGPAAPRTAAREDG